MNRLAYIRLLIAAMCVLAIGGCNSQRSVATKEEVSTQKEDTVWEISARKKALLSYMASSHLSNVGKGEVVCKESRRLESISDRLRSYIEKYLATDAREAFREERKAYSLWRSTQLHLADKVIIAFWDLYAGGSAGSSFQTGYLYDIENLNYEDMTDLLQSFQGQSFYIPRVRRVTPRQQEEEHASIVGEAQERGLSQEVINLLNGDYYLFKSWMRKRRKLSRLLPGGIDASYDRMTRVIIDEHLWEYKVRFIEFNYNRLQNSEKEYAR